MANCIANRCSDPPTPVSPQSGPPEEGDIASVFSSPRDPLSQLIGDPTADNNTINTESQRAPTTLQSYQSERGKYRPCLVYDEDQFCVMSTFGGKPSYKIEELSRHFLVPVHPNTETSKLFDRHLHTTPDWPLKENRPQWIVAHPFIKPINRETLEHWSPNGRHYRVDEESLNEFKILCEQRSANVRALHPSEYEKLVKEFRERPQPKRSKTSTAVNVLIYSGPEIVQTSLNHALTSLKSILLPHYTVQPVTQQTLMTQPWQSSCALLVLPRSHNRFVSIASKLIQEFVDAGGAYLMLGTTASAIPRSGGLGLGSTGLSLGLEAGETPLKFYDKFSNRYITFDEDDTKDRVEPRILTLQTSDGVLVKGIYDTRASEFRGFEDIKRKSDLARYQVDGKETIAGLNLKISKGRIALWGPSIEHPLTEPPASSAIADLTKLTPTEIEASDKGRIKLISATLTKLGLQIPQGDEGKPTIFRPLPQFLTSTPAKPTIVSQITDGIAAPQSGIQLSTFKDGSDKFHFHPLEECLELFRSAREQAETSNDPSIWHPKHIIICRDGVLPDRESTPLFDLDLFYKSLSSARKKEGLTETSAGSWGMGEALMYGEAVTSTQTMLDKNPHLLSRLPTPLLSLASHQLEGRGRGSNIWLSPSGCLQFSLFLRVSLANVPQTKLVFIQYLFALAVVKACLDETVLGPKAGEKVRLKWPNDIYASVGAGKGALRKIGGILVNTSFSGDNVDIVIGCGLNILNPPPIASLSQLQQAATLSMELTAAVIMAKFEPMWTTFIEKCGSFEPFMNLYLERWLHSDQLVTLTTTNPHTAVRIVGITPDHGLLRTIPERSSVREYPSSGEAEYIDLQPDGNSFDLMSNLIISKS